jgi:Tfp pilus assembly protein FimT
MDTSNTHKRTYIVVGIVFVLLVVVALVMFRAPARTAAASAKAQELTAAFELAGLNAPSEQQIVGTLGEDGGVVCKTDFGNLIESNLNLLLTNGAAQVGARGIIIDAKVLTGEAIILSVYCPERLPEYKEYVDQLKTADLIKE